MTEALLSVNVADIRVGTRTLGPGLRSVAWVQGCDLDCPGCVAPQWIHRNPASLFTPEELAQRLLADPQVDGITISGGEPTLQPRALAATIRAVRALRNVNVICFTGHTLASLRGRPQSAGIHELLECIDVLIDGPYRAAQDDGRGLRGSANQMVHLLTDRLQGQVSQLDTAPREVEILVRDRDVLLVGVPSRQVLNRLDQVARRSHDLTRGALGRSGAGRDEPSTPPPQM